MSIFRTTISFILLVSFTVTTVNLPAQAMVDFHKYINTKYKYSIDYPSNLKKQPASDSDQVQVFSSTNSKVELFVRYSPMRRSWDTKLRTLNSEWKDALLSREQDGDSVTFKKKGPNWFVLSGYSSAYDKASIYYMKLIIGKNGVTEFHFKYPTERKSEFDPVVAKIARSFSLNLKTKSPNSKPHRITKQKSKSSRDKTPSIEVEKLFPTE